MKVTSYDAIYCLKVVNLALFAIVNCHEYTNGTGYFTERQNYISKDFKNMCWFITSFMQ